MAFRLACVLVVFALRFLAHGAPIVPAIDAPPPPLEDRLAAIDDDERAPPADAPSDLDDDDDDDDDAALTARFVTAVPPSIVIRPAWSVRTLADRPFRASLFRPPPSA